ncbi:hypothetical protein AGMMS49543_20840 [Betaproteobacteria bacterium]|nr:hypothetical protein AGMMS49543_20840 [Betaproteobacteria bacterium]
MAISKNHSKYRAVKTVVNGITFSSKKEAKRYNILLAQQQAGEISSLQLQPIFELQEGFKMGKRKISAIKYIADFSYQRADTGAVVVEDVKGMKTRVYSLKKKMFLKKYGEMYEFMEV